MPTTRNTLCAALILVASASTLSAQGRQGFGMSFGLGWGSAGVKCEECEIQTDERVEGLAGYVRVGAHVNPHLFVGVEGTGWLKNTEGVERRIASVSFVSLVYPSASAGFFLHGGFGGIRAVIENDLISVVGTGLTWQAGAGYDIPIGSGAALTPYVTYLGSSNVAADLNGISTGLNLNPNILQAGFALTVR
jgi:hypothetical protein